MSGADWTDIADRYRRLDLQRRFGRGALYAVGKRLKCEKAFSS